MLATWVEAGQNPGIFFDLGPREYAATIAGARSRLEREHNGRAWLAWHVAALGRVKKMPPLTKLMHGASGARRQSWQEQKAMARVLNAAFGGSFHKQGDES